MEAVTRRHVEEDIGVLPFLEQLRSSLRASSFRALPVRQVAIPKKSGKLRQLGIPTLRDRVAQMALKLILELIFEVDFYPSSYGYRPGRRAQDAIAEIHHLISRVIEGTSPPVSTTSTTKSYGPGRRHHRTGRCCAWSAGTCGPALSNRTAGSRRA
jgi:hypothetical protein